jgi:hypothetical protein
MGCLEGLTGNKTCVHILAKIVQTITSLFAQPFTHDRQMPIYKVICSLRYFILCKSPGL